MAEGGRPTSISTIDAPSFGGALTDGEGRTVPQERMWPLLDLFFEREMHRQDVVPGALDALARDRGEQADIVILTNIGDDYQANRVAQLEAFDIRHRVLCNQGGKGRPVRELIDEMRPSVALFVDDLAVHHESVAKHAPEVWRLHMVAEPRWRSAGRPSPHAHARIDDWASGLALDRRAAGGPHSDSEAQRGRMTDKTIFITGATAGIGARRGAALRQRRLDA